MIVKARIHYHSDCPFFGGCENMLVNFFNSQEFCEGFDLFVQLSLFQSLRRRVLQEGERSSAGSSASPSRSTRCSGILDGFSPLISRIAGWMATLPILVMQIAILYRFFWEKAPDVLHINNGGYPAALSAELRQSQEGWPGWTKSLWLSTIWPLITIDFHVASIIRLTDLLYVQSIGLLQVRRLPQGVCQLFFGS